MPSPRPTTIRSAHERPATIAAMAARAIVFYLAERGHAPADVMKRFALDEATLADVDGRILATTMLAIWDALPGMLSDPDVGIHLGEWSVASGPAMPWHLMRASTTLGEGLERLVSLWRFFNDVHGAELFADGDERMIRMVADHAVVPVPRQGVEFAFTWFVGVARRATNANVNPRWVSFGHGTPVRTSEHARVFGCEVRFDAPYASIAYSKEDLALPMAAPEPELADVLQRHAAGLMAKLPDRSAFTARVRGAMVPLLPSADVSLARVATALAESPRSVQRHLHEEGTTLQRVLDDLRRDLAIEQLRARERPIAEIALLLGFSDQTTFHRAFVRWTGKTPGDVRRLG